MTSKRIRDLMGEKKLKYAEYLNIDKMLLQAKIDKRVKQSEKHIGKCYRSTYFSKASGCFTLIKIVSLDAAGRFNTKQVSKQFKSTSVFNSSCNEIENGFEPISEEEFKRMTNEALRSEMEK